MINSSKKRHLGPALFGAAFACCFLSTAAFADIIVDSTGDDDISGSPNGRCTLREAIANANTQSAGEKDCAAGDKQTTIRFAPGTNTVNLDPALGEIGVLSGTSVDIRGPVTVRLPSGVKGVRQFAIHKDAAVSMESVEMENGDNTAGGLVNVEAGAQFDMRGGAARFGSALVGGAIATNGEVRLEGVEFSSNTANYGGAVYNVSNSPLNLIKSAFFDNQANASGGALRSTGPTLIIGTTFIANTANGDEGGGGAISFLGAHDILIDGSIFRDNIVRGDTGGGAAEFADTTQVVFNNCEFRDNKVASLKPTAGGGAIVEHGSSWVSLSRSNFVGNIGWVGGAAYVGPGSGLDASNTTWTHNFADSTGFPARPDSGSGAAVYLDGSGLFLENVTVKDNEGTSQLSLANGGQITFTNSVMWTQQGVLNCDGQGIDLGGNLQNTDAAGASCGVPASSVPASAVFSTSIQIFKSIDDDTPDSGPVVHDIWVPKVTGPLAGAGLKLTCTYPPTVNSADEQGIHRPANCDIGAIEVP